MYTMKNLPVLEKHGPACFFFFKKSVFLPAEMLKDDVEYLLHI